jgi:hypothetical protein
MADLQRYPETDESSGTGPRREPDRRRWARVALVVAVIVVVVAMAVLHLTGTLGPGSQ